MNTLIAITWAIVLYGAGTWFDARWEQRRADQREWRRAHT